MIDNLVSPDLLRSVRAEIQDHLSFTPKETDIFKIHQSGDLVNLDGLDDSSLKLLPSLLKLRNALYSKPFREHLSAITAAGDLSGRKTDMAINVYTPGCHLLCHDDVIGSRRVSYILYLTDPDAPWKPEWGGALRLYPTVARTGNDGNVSKIPSPDHELSIPPAFNRLSFFAVQPGESYHDVEEVYAYQGGDEAKDNMRIRTAISGWYHIPQKGEEGFVEGLEENLAGKSSLRQLEGKADEFDRPMMNFQNPIVGNNSFSSNDDQKTPALSQEDVFLSEDDLTFLIKYIAPTYLTPDTLESVAEVFSEDWSLTLDGFLTDKFSQSLRDFISIQESQVLPTASPDIEKATPWTVARPPHKHRFLYQQTRKTRPLDPRSQSPVQDLLENLLPSIQFYKWLQLATGQTISSHNLSARRFRRGNDYSLASGYDEEDPRLEITLAITPSSGWERDAEVEEDVDKVVVAGNVDQITEDSAAGKLVDEEQVDNPEEKPVEPDNLVVGGDVSQAEAAPAEVSKAVVEKDVDEKRKESVEPGKLDTIHNDDVGEVKVAPTAPPTVVDVDKSDDPTHVEVGKRASTSDVGEAEIAPTEVNVSKSKEGGNVEVGKRVSEGDVGEKGKDLDEVDNYVTDEKGGKTGTDSNTVNERQVIDDHGREVGDVDEAEREIEEVQQGRAGHGVEGERETEKVQEGRAGHGVEADDLAQNSDGAPGGDIGGYLAYMAGDEADSGNADETPGEPGVDLPSNMSTGARASGFSKAPKSDPAVYQSAGQGDEDDGVLFSMPAGWNKLGIVLRDKGALRFVKYVSRQAKGDRWDLCGEYTIVVEDEAEAENLVNADYSNDTTEQESTTSDD